MRVAAREDSAVLEVVEGRPERVWWGGERWEIIDSPTPSWGSQEHPLITHPVRIITSWRFTGRNNEGQVYTFDFARQGMTWRLANVWD